MGNRIHRLFPSDHPAAVGHFPGNPIIPGAVLLNDVRDSIGKAERVSPMSFEISSAKFLRPVRPGDSVEIAWEKRANGEIRFDCLVTPEDRSAMTGILKPAGGRT